MYLALIEALVLSSGDAKEKSITFFEKLKLNLKNNSSKESTGFHNNICSQMMKHFAS